MDINNLVAAIEANCDAYHVQRISREVWSAEQSRLWKLAAEAGIASELMRRVCPSLTVPPYAVRQSLRDATLAVGR